MTAFDIQPTVRDDIPGLHAVLDGTGLFPSEMLEDLLEPALSGASEAMWLTAHLQGVAVGFCYCVPEALTTGTWNMLALGISPVHQGKGFGAQLVAAAEARLRADGRRVLIVDTSGTDSFVRTRAFYAKQGYDEVARIPDYWDAGDAKVTFFKAL